MSWDENQNPWYDNVIDLDDIMPVALQFGRASTLEYGLEEDKYCPNYDITDDGVIDMDDVILGALKYGKLDPYTRRNREYKLWEPIKYGNNSWGLKNLGWDSTIGVYEGTISWGIPEWDYKRGVWGTCNTDSKVVGNLGITTGYITWNPWIRQEKLISNPSFSGDASSRDHKVTFHYKYKKTRLNFPLNLGAWFGIGVNVWGKFNQQIGDLDGWEIFHFTFYNGIALAIPGISRITTLREQDGYKWLFTQFRDVEDPQNTWVKRTISLKKDFNALLKIVGYDKSGYTEGFQFIIETKDGGGSLSIDYCKYDAPVWC